MSEFTIATANAQEGKLLTHPDGLVPFTESNTDVLLMQEVIDHQPKQLNERLQADGYRIVHYSGALGLLIAVSDASMTKMEFADPIVTLIHEPKGLERVAQTIPAIQQRVRPRGAISVNMKLDGEHDVRLMTTHPIVFLRYRSRRQQIKAIAKVYKDPSGDSPLVIGADFNHYPRPQKVDLDMHTALGLSKTELDTPTWPIRGSKHEWLARIGSIATGRSLDSFDAELDAILYKGLSEVKTVVVPIKSDHRAVISTFTI